MDHSAVVLQYMTSTSYPHLVSRRPVTRRFLMVAVLLELAVHFGVQVDVAFTDGHTLL